MHTYWDLACRQIKTRQIVLGIDSPKFPTIRYIKDTVRAISVILPAAGQYRNVPCLSLLAID